MIRRIAVILLASSCTGLYAQEVEPEDDDFDFDPDDPDFDPNELGDSEEFLDEDM